MACVLSLEIFKVFHVFHEYIAGGSKVAGWKSIQLKWTLRSANLDVSQGNQHVRPRKLLATIFAALGHGILSYPTS